MIKIDDVDKNIIWFMWNLKKDKTATTSDIAKSIFDIKKSNQLMLKDVIVRQKLKRMIKYGIVTGERVDGKMRYMVNGSLLTCGIGEVMIKNKSIKTRIILLKEGDKTHVFGSFY